MGDDNVALCNTTDLVVKNALALLSRLLNGLPILLYHAISENYWRNILRSLDLGAPLKEKGRDYHRFTGNRL